MNKTIHGIQVMRGIAASMVTFGHFAAVASDISGSDRNLSSLLLSFHTTIGQSGVDIFFCISGFIIVLITGKQRRNTAARDAAYFLSRRIIRIYPLFWVALAVSIIVELTWLNVVGEQAWLTVVGHGPLASIALYDTPVALPIAWTLMFEIRFYALIALVLLVFRANLQKGILIACLGIVVCVSLTSLEILPYVRIGDRIMLEFVFGALVGLAVINRVTVLPRVMVIVGLFWFLATTFFTSGDVAVYRIWGYGFPAALFLYGLVTIERQRGLRAPRWLLAIGDWSYSIYLWHWVIMKSLAHGAVQLGQGPTIAIAFMATGLAATYFAGYLSFRFIERPLFQVAKFSRRPQEPAPAT